MQKKCVHSASKLKSQDTKQEEHYQEKQLNNLNFLILENIQGKAST